MTAEKTPINPNVIKETRIMLIFFFVWLIGLQVYQFLVYEFIGLLVYQP